MPCVTADFPAIVFGEIFHYVDIIVALLCGEGVSVDLDSRGGRSFSLVDTKLEGVSVILYGMGMRVYPVRMGRNAMRMRADGMGMRRDIMRVRRVSVFAGRHPCNIAANRRAVLGCRELCTASDSVIVICSTRAAIVGRVVLRIARRKPGRARGLPAAGGGSRTAAGGGRRAATA